MLHSIVQLPIAAVFEVLAKMGAQAVGAAAHTPSPKSPEKKQSPLLSYKEPKTLKDISHSQQHLYRLEEAGKFPKRIDLGGKSVAWCEHQVESGFKVKHQRSLIQEGIN